MRRELPNAQRLAPNARGRRLTERRLLQTPPLNAFGEAAGDESHEFLP